LPEGIRVRIIYNPVAGEGRFGIDRDSLEMKMKDASKAQGKDLEVSSLMTECKGDCEEMARQALKEGVDVVAVAGGDGTIMEAASALANTDTALGILPVGSGNDTIFSIGGHRDLDKCIADILGPCRRRLDMGTMNGKPFLNVVGIGLDAQINHLVAKKRRLVLKYGPALVYAQAAVKVLLDYRPFRISVSYDARPPMELPISLCTIGNGTVCGGGFRLTPLAVMDDGLLDLSVSEHVGLLRSLWNIPTAYRGAHLGMAENHYHQARSITIVGLEGALPVHLDGEGGYEERMDLKIMPSCLTVVHPNIGSR